MDEAHDVHGLHGLLEVVFVLLTRDWDVTVRQETVVVESFQKQVRCGEKNGKTLRNMVKIGFVLFFTRSVKENKKCLNGIKAQSTYI